MTTTAAYMITVESNHTIRLPKEVSVGAMVAVIVMPNEQAEAARRARFAATLEAIRKASRQTKTPKMAETEFSSQ
jgi:hypothetical protein